MIDLSYFESVAEGDVSFIRQMMKTFIEDVPVMVQSINDNFLSKNQSGLHKAIHKLKPSWSMSGLDVSLLHNIEADIKSGKDFHLLEENLKTLANIAEQAVAEMLEKYSLISND